MVTYRLDHPTFKNALLTTGPDRDFTASYDGWGCLPQVIVLIEYVNPEQSPEIAEFDMCAALGCGQRTLRRMRSAANLLAKADAATTQLVRPSTPSNKIIGGYGKSRQRSSMSPF